jgi:putative OPT family oligopeptide transporter
MTNRPIRAEFTVRALVLGVVLSAVLAGANAYLGMKVGMTVSASIPAAVISMGIFRFLRRSTIVENNLVQTAASAGEALAAGAIFTLPALILLGQWDDFRYWPVTLVAGFGGLLGVLFSIPLRRALVVEGELRFPEGVATAEVLKAGDEGGHGLRLISIAAATAAAVKFGQTGLRVLAGSLSGAVTAGRAVVPFGCDLSLALLGVGFIVRFNIAVLVFAGGVLAWGVAIPIYTAIHGVPAGTEGYGAAAAVWSSKIRYIGVGAMVVGGIWALAAASRKIARALQLAFDYRSRTGAAGSAVPLEERDLPSAWIGAATVVIVAALTALAVGLVNSSELSLSAQRRVSLIVIIPFLAVIAGFLFSAVAGYMAGLVGSSHNPVSGVTIATILLTSFVLLALIGPGPAAAGGAMAILVGAVVCCAAAISGDNLQDLKAGHLVGATPYRQQIMQILGVVAAACVLAPILSLLYNAYGFTDALPRHGMNPADALPVPQATLMTSVAQGVFARDLEWGMIGLGVLVAVLVIILDLILEARGSTFRTPVLAVAVGVYLPLELTAPMLIGGILAWLTSRRPGTDMRSGLLVASGLIAGEAMMGILLAIPFAASGRTDVLAVPLPAGYGAMPSILMVLLLAVVAIWMIRAGRNSERP